jgi:hypothetical protein
MLTALRSSAGRKSKLQVRLLDAEGSLSFGQLHARVLQEITQYPHKILSIFEPHTEIIRKGKVSKPTSSAKS